MCIYCFKLHLQITISVVSKDLKFLELIIAIRTHIMYADNISLFYY